MNRCLTVVESYGDISEEVRVASREALPDVAGRLAQLQAQVMLRLQEATPQPVQRALLTVPEAATYMSLSRSSVYELLKAGRIPAVEIGGSTRLDPADLDAFIAKKKTRRR